MFTSNLIFLFDEFRDREGDKEEKRFRVLLKYNNQMIGYSENYNQKRTPKQLSNLFQDIQNSRFEDKEENGFISISSKNHQEVFRLFSTFDITPLKQEIGNYVFDIESGNIKESERNDDSGSKHIW